MSACFSIDVPPVADDACSNESQFDQCLDKRLQEILVFPTTHEYAEDVAVTLIPRQCDGLSHVDYLKRSHGTKHKLTGTTETQPKVCLNKTVSRAVETFFFGSTQEVQDDSANVAALSSTSGNLTNAGETTPSAFHRTARTSKTLVPPQRIVTAPLLDHIATSSVILKPTDNGMQSHTYHRSAAFTQLQISNPSCRTQFFGAPVVPLMEELSERNEATQFEPVRNIVSVNDDAVTRKNFFGVDHSSIAPKLQNLREVSLLDTSRLDMPLNLSTLPQPKVASSAVTNSDNFSSHQNLALHAASSINVFGSTDAVAVKAVEKHAVPKKRLTSSVEKPSQQQATRSSSRIRAQKIPTDEIPIVSSASLKINCDTDAIPAITKANSTRNVSRTRAQTALGMKLKPCLPSLSSTADELPAVSNRSAAKPPPVLLKPLVDMRMDGFVEDFASFHTVVCVPKVGVPLYKRYHANYMKQSREHQCYGTSGVQASGSQQNISSKRAKAVASPAVSSTTYSSLKVRNIHLIPSEIPLSDQISANKAIAPVVPTITTRQRSAKRARTSLGFARNKATKSAAVSKVAAAELRQQAAVDEIVNAGNFLEIASTYLESAATHSRSQLTDLNIRPMLNEQNFKLLPSYAQQALIPLLPPCDRIVTNANLTHATAAAISASLAAAALPQNNGRCDTSHPDIARLLDNAPRHMSENSEHERQEFLNMVLYEAVLGGDDSATTLPAAEATAAPRGAGTSANGLYRLHLGALACPDLLTSVNDYQKLLRSGALADPLKSQLKAKSRRDYDAMDEWKKRNYESFWGEHAGLPGPIESAEFDSSSMQMQAINRMSLDQRRTMVKAWRSSNARILNDAVKKCVITQQPNVAPVVVAAARVDAVLLQATLPAQQPQLSVQPSFTSYSPAIALKRNTAAARRPKIRITQTPDNEDENSPCTPLSPPPPTMAANGVSFDIGNVFDFATIPLTESISCSSGLNTAEQRAQTLLSATTAVAPPTAEVFVPQAKQQQQRQLMNGNAATSISASFNLPHSHAVDSGQQQVLASMRTMTDRVVC